MLTKKLIAGIWILFTLPAPLTTSYAQSGDDGLGQTIQIYTHLRSFIGKPAWLLIIRDLDHGQELPYLFEVKRGDNFWVAFTFSRNYMITVSNLQFGSYKARINNFCNIQSGTIEGESMYITLNGDLTPDHDTYNCNVSLYADANFTIAPQQDQTTEKQP